MITLLKLKIWGKQYLPYLKEHPAISIMETDTPQKQS
jgi:hypothetical protein